MPLILSGLTALCLLIVSYSVRVAPAGLMGVLISSNVLARLAWWLWPSLWTFYAIRYFESGANNSLELVKSYRTIVPISCMLLGQIATLLLFIVIYGNTVELANANDFQILQFPVGSASSYLLLALAIGQLVWQWSICRKYTELTDVFIVAILVINLIFMQAAVALGRSLLFYGVAACTVQIIMPTLGKLSECVFGTRVFRA
ncbi:MAG: hypothetical protein ABFD83_00360 [Armatimonadota bacterium]